MRIGFNGNQIYEHGEVANGSHTNLRLAVGGSEYHIDLDGIDKTCVPGALIGSKAGQLHIAWSGCSNCLIIFVTILIRADGHGAAVSMHSSISSIDGFFAFSTMRSAMMMI